jgi:DNA primase small subunit
VRLLEKSLKDIVFAYTYPRLDVEVSKKMNHLLKAPFCVHPKTGKVCVPIDPRHAWEFDPDTVCTVGQLLNELNGNGELQSESEEPAWKTTKMGQAVKTFEQCFLNGIQAENKAILMSRMKNSSSTLAW